MLARPLAVKVCNIEHTFLPVFLTILKRVKDQTKERWFQVCQLAAIEEDPEKLLALVTEIILCYESPHNGCG
jgi:hypothetical protein